MYHGVIVAFGSPRTDLNGLRLSAHYPLDPETIELGEGLLGAAATDPESTRGVLPRV